MFVFLIYTVYTCMHDSICKTLITSFPQFCWQLVAIIIHQIFSLARGWFKRVTWLKILQLKLGNIRVILPNFQIYMCCEKYMKDNKHKKLSFGAKICTDICPRTLHVPQSLQFFLSWALGKLFASLNRKCLRTNIREYFRTKWKLLCLLLFQKYFSPRAQF